MDIIAQWLYISSLAGGVLLGSLAWTVNALRWTGALALGACIFTIGEGAFMLLLGIQSCARIVDEACGEYRSFLLFMALGVAAIAGGCVGLAALRRRAARRAPFAVAGILAMAAFGFALGPSFFLACGPPVILLALAVGQPRLRYS